MKRFLHTLLLISLFVVFPFAAFAQPDASEDRVMLDAIRSFTVPVHTVVRDDCGHCIDMKAFSLNLKLNDKILQSFITILMKQRIAHYLIKSPN